MLYIASSALSYFTTGSLYILTPSTHISDLPSPPLAIIDMFFFLWQECFLSIIVPLWEGLVLRFSMNDVEWKKSHPDDSPWSLLPSGLLVPHPSTMACDKSFREALAPSLLSSSPLGSLSQLSSCFLLTTHDIHPFLPTALTYIGPWVRKVW